MVNLNRLPAELSNDSMTYIGEVKDAVVARGIAAGDLDPNTQEHLIVSSVPRTHAAHQSRSMQTPDEKQGKPISEFFKPVRTPLAELDPNSFTPSSSQQQLLRSQQGLSWSASQVQAQRPSALSRVAAANALSSTSQGVRRVHSEPKAARKSPKRQRLCSESALPASGPQDHSPPGSASRFFSKQETEPSPSLRKPSLQRRKKDEFELWSDDSVAEAVAQVTALEESVVSTKAPSPRKRKKFEVFADAANLNEADAADVSQGTAGTSFLETSQDTTASETPMTSFEAQETPADRNIFIKGIDADFAALKARCTFQSVSPRKKFSRTNSVPSMSKIPIKAARTIQSANSKVESNHVPKLEPTNDANEDLAKEEAEILSTVLSDESPSTAEGLHPAADDAIDDAEWLAIEQREISSTLGMKGSEDCLVPNSPESREDDTPSTTKLDLGRFAFAGS